MDRLTDRCTRFFSAANNAIPAHTSGRPIRRLRRLEAGYSLTETLTVLAIIAMTGTAVPVMTDLLARTHVTTLTNQLVTDLHYARSSAVMRRQRISLCQSADGRQCGRSDHWEMGWLLFADLNNNKWVDEDEPVLRVQTAARPGYTLRWQGSLGSNYYVSYLPTGNANKAGTFTVCGQRRREHARTVILSRTGRPRTAKTLWTGEAPDC